MFAENPPIVSAELNRRVFAPARAQATQRLDLYAIADHASRLQAAIDAGVQAEHSEGIGMTCR